MSRKKVSSTVWMTQQQHDALRDIKRRTGKPMSVLHREGLDCVIERYALNQTDTREHAQRALRAAADVRNAPSQGEPHPKLSELAGHIERLHADLSQALSAVRQCTSDASHARGQIQRVFQAAESALAAEPPDVS